MKRLLALVVVLFATPLAARADTIWQKAKAPSKWAAAGLLTDEELHRDVAVKYTRALREKPLTADWFSNLEGARNVLIAQRWKERTDPRIAYDAGLVHGAGHHFTECAEMLELALSRAPAHPLAATAAFELGICYSKLGKHADEERAYLRAIEASDRASLKAITYSNLSESRMAQGKLEAGIEAAEAALEHEPDLPSGQYNLAILKDRSGDAAGALESAKHAVELDPEGEYLGDVEGVFFEPAYEKHWYVALRVQALSEREQGDARTLLLMAALGSYHAWLEASDPADRYRKRCEEIIARLEKQLKLKKK